MNPLDTNALRDVDIRITPHGSLNSSQGGISEEDLINETEADLMEVLREQSVTAVKRISLSRDANK